MGLNIKNVEVERLAEEVSRLTHETKTEAIRRALQERKERLTVVSDVPRRKNLKAFLETVVWPQMPPDVLGKSITKEEWEDILGFGPGGF